MLHWESGSESGKVGIYQDAQHKWDRIAGVLGLEPGEVESIRRNKYDDHDRVTAVFHRWLDNANKLPNCSRYPKTWSGLIRLLNDSGLGELASRLKKALNAPISDARGNYDQKK